MASPTASHIPRSADELRSAFSQFFADRGHSVVPSASLIPHDQTLLFTVAGMVPFKPYFMGDEVAPYNRAATVQKCVRAGGKHNDLDEVGRTKRHLVFFEMLGNFSFGDYFKTDAIKWSWELVTEVFGFDGDKLWITVHESDDEAEKIWHEQVGVPMERIQRLGDKDNFWQAGDTDHVVHVLKSTSIVDQPLAPMEARQTIQQVIALWSSGTWCSCSTTRAVMALALHCRNQASILVLGLNVFWL